MGNKTKVGSIHKTKRQLFTYVDNDKGHYPTYRSGKEVEIVAIDHLNVSNPLVCKYKLKNRKGNEIEGTVNLNESELF